MNRAKLYWHKIPDGPFSKEWLWVQVELGLKKKTINVMEKYHYMTDDEIKDIETHILKRVKQ